MDFITMDMFLTLAGCIVVVMLIVEALKIYFKQINALLLNFITSIIVGVTRILIIGDFTWQGILLGILNIFVIMLAAGGGYDTVKTITSKFKDQGKG